MDDERSRRNTRQLLRDIKATGFDGVEIPVFVGAPDDYKKLGELLDRIGLERTAVSAMGDPGNEPDLRRCGDAQGAASTT